MNYKIAIDTGGTFTDCIAQDETGKTYRQKVLSSSALRGTIVAWVDDQTLKIQESWKLQKDIIQGYSFQILQRQPTPHIRIQSYDTTTKTLTLSHAIPAELQHNGDSFEITGREEAPVLAARLITQTPLQEKLPPVEMKLGTTRGTNALLENKGATTFFIVTKGFRDLLSIGTQQRKDIFALSVEKPRPLPGYIFEIEECVDAEGNVILPLSDDELARLENYLNKHRHGHIQSFAICLMNSYKNPVHEKLLEEALEKMGYILQSCTLSTDLSSMMKFLPRAETTVVNAYLDPILESYLGDIHAKVQQLKVMSSAGSLLLRSGFYAKDSLLSGPAGGIVGAADIGQQVGYSHLITFDMGGTSTDVARYDGQPDYTFEVEIGHAHIFSPALSIETVAAGGGSLCYFDGFKLCVGPESAGAFPGPACYGAGGDLAITDVNLLLGRLDASQFGIPVFPAQAEKKLEDLLKKIYKKTGERRSKAALLEGFLHIANETMAGAIKKISTAKGYDPANYVMVAFGGAGGLHACGVARLLGISTILLPKDAGLLSACGIHQAQEEVFEEKQLLKNWEDAAEQLSHYFNTLKKQAIARLFSKQPPREPIDIKKRLVYLRFQGQEHTLEVDFSQKETVLQDFEEKYTKIYGYYPKGKAIEIESIRLVAARQVTPSIEFLSAFDLSTYAPIPHHFIQASTGNIREEIPVFLREELETGAKIHGFALLLDNYSTTVIEKGWELVISSCETAILSQTTNGQAHTTTFSTEIQLELFTNRFRAIAENMGAMLQRTAFSVNVKERLDFSCALLDAGGELIANAPHIPVHLGSLGVCVRALCQYIPMEEGDTVVTNHPRYGGSHLPDVTLVTPVFGEDKQLIGYVVNRAHHAEMGGTRPASMPPDAQNLEEEGVIMEPFYLVRGGKVDWEGIRKILTQGKYPSRSVEENMADLNAALAANKNGEAALQRLVRDFGLPTVHQYMDLLKQHAAQKTQEVLSNLGELPLQLEAEEFLDDGSPLRVKIQIEEESCTIDFSGSAPTHPGNLNANEAIVQSVVMYVLRLLLREDIPLNDGLLQSVSIILPEDSLLNPTFPEDPAQCPAVVGGNVETSQRLTDTLLKAFGVVACSQGTMNNVLFGNDSFGYYETICGGCGAGEGFHGASAVHHHMTNTRITDPEIMEHRYPVRLHRFGIRPQSGGKGRYNGGNGIIREIEFLKPVSLSVLTQHRKEVPYGLQGGEAGKAGKQYILRKNGEKEILEGIDGVEMDAGDRLVIETPGGGGFGKA